ncbi:MAG: hypothetical protein IT233_02220 [Bacteroidia bacterium]|nr:hypothetical protein [Bacteroidia bacterium]
MKNLKNLLLIFLMAAVAVPVAAQKKKVVVVSPGGHPKVEKHHARKVLHRTAVVIFHAHKWVKQGKNYTGDLAKAIAHQRFAKKLYAQGKYHRAIHQSRVARLYAIKAIKANKGTDIEESKITEEEKELFKSGPSDDELIKEMNAQNPGAKYSDEDNLISEPDIDLNADE